MIPLKVEVNGREATVAMLNTLKAGMAAPMMRAMGKAAAISIRKRTDEGKDQKDKLLKPIKDQSSTVLNRSGKMLNAIYLERADAKVAVISFRTPREAQKAEWQHYGTTGPYPIRPKKGKALAWKSGPGRGKSSMSFARSVMHPGLPPRPFFGLSPTDLANIERAGDKQLAELIKAANG